MLEPKFDHLKRESEIYKMWESSGALSFEHAPSTAPVFNIAMPPPNANGELHLGHSFGYTLMDILGRYHRMAGERVLLLPGKDHAGIQTQVVFEKKLQKEGVDLKSTPTEELFQRCYEFCIDRAHYMRSQEKSIGLSADWNRELFTLDPRLNTIVYETFEKLWRDGLVYRGKRIVNWSVFSQTSISDVEVEYREQDGELWYILYPWVEAPNQSGSAEITLPNGQAVRAGSRGLIAATTRPETMLGDTALAVNPDDDRYKSFIGSWVKVPLTGREIQVIADARIDPTFGTGVVKVTPAHDFADYDIGTDHRLPIIEVIGKNGRMTDAAGSGFAGMKIQECRESVVKKLEEAELLLGSAPIKHKVPIGERGKDIIEPLISEQWFIAVDKPGMSLRENALALLRSGKLSIYPERFKVLFEQWLENLRDWNVSRQLWWGHQLPVWYRGEGESAEICVSKDAPSGEGWRRDTDVFDTWFSSGQWAYSTMAANDLLDLDAPGRSEFFPTHTMVMGRDILFFWACRMLLLTTYRLNDVPWRNIFFTGLVRDEHGQKMSKSKGNGVEPLKMIERFGADALRLATVMGATPGNDIAFSERKVDGYSKFMNKLWNVAKLLETRFGGAPGAQANTPPRLETSRWILSELHDLHTRVTDKINQYELSIAADEIYRFTWTTFCDWYLEEMKILLDKGDDAIKSEVREVTRVCFRSILKLLHPFIPFVTEEIYQKLPLVQEGPMLMTERWTVEAPPIAEVNHREITDLMAAVSAVRSVKATLQIPHQRIRASISRDLSPEFTLLFSELAKIELTAESSIDDAKALRKPFPGGIVCCEVENRERYRQRLEADAATARATVELLTKKLAGDFATQAKPEVVEKERERLAQAQSTLNELESELAIGA